MDVFLASQELFFATMTGDVEKAEEALKDGADPNFQNSNGMTPLLVCSGGVGPPAMADLLLRSGAHVDHPDPAGWTPLLFISSSGQLPLLDTLLKHGADPNAVAHADEKKWTPLLRATYRGHAHVVERLLAHGADAAVRAPDGASVLEVAQRAGHMHVAEFLTSRSESNSPLR